MTRATQFTRHTCYRTIKIVLLLLWMAVIFAFSSADATESTESSHMVGRIVGRIVMEDFSGWEMEEQEAFAETIDFYVRKSAHFTEYMVLGILCYLALEGKKRLSWLLGTCYAVSDEIHQLFVPGRSCQLRDVMIDSAGVMAGVLLTFMAVWLVNTVQNYKKQNTV